MHFLFSAFEMNVGLTDIHITQISLSQMGSNDKFVVIVLKSMYILH